MKRAISIMLIITLLLLMPVVSYAATLNTNGAGELTIVLKYGNTFLGNRTVSLIKVAEATLQNNKLVYALTPEFAECDVDLGDFETNDSESNISISATLSSYANVNNVGRTNKTTPNTGADRGTVKYTNLNPGLYLITMVTNSSYRMTPMVVPVPMMEEDGFINYLITATPKVQPIPDETTTPDTTTSPPDTDPETTPPPETDPETTPRETDPETTPPPETDPETDPETTPPPETDPETTPPPDPEDPPETPGPEDPPETPGPEDPPETPGPEDPPETTPPDQPQNPREPVYVDGIGELTPTDVEDVYMIIGDDGVPLYFKYDPELDEWIPVDEFGVPLGMMLPQTGLLRWPVPVLTGSGMILTAAGLIITGKGKKRDDEE